MKLNLTLSKSSINAAIREVENYRKRIREKMGEFVRKLAEAGIAVANENRGDYGNLIYFYATDTRYSDNTATVNVVGTDTKIVRKHDAQQRAVSPLLMAEFGSGWLANVVWDVEGVGQGTFPGQHLAFNPNGWFYIDDNDVKQHSYGEAPTYPMHRAYLAMLSEADRIAKEVFSE